MVSTSGIPKNRSNEYSVRVLKRLINDTLAIAAFRRSSRRDPSSEEDRRESERRVSTTTGCFFVLGRPTRACIEPHTIINCPEKARLACASASWPVCTLGGTRETTDACMHAMHACVHGVRNAHMRLLARSLARAKRVRKRGDLFTGGTGPT